MIQYTLDAAASTDLSAIEHAIATLDPSVLLDRDASGSTIRISTLVTELELQDLLRDSGVVDPSRHLSRAPSECCGGCGG